MVVKKQVFSLKTYYALRGNGMWNKMLRSYLMLHAHTDTNQPASNLGSLTSGGGEGIPMCCNIGTPFGSPEHLTTPLLPPKQVVAILQLFRLPYINIWRSSTLIFEWFRPLSPKIVQPEDGGGTKELKQGGNNELSVLLSPKVEEHRWHMERDAEKNQWPQESELDWVGGWKHCSLTAPGKAVRKLSLKAFLWRSCYPLALGSLLIKTERNISLY